MAHSASAPSSNAPKSGSKRRKVNWHEAAVCAMQIELRDYADLLEYQPEFVLGKNSYRIDLLVIKKLSGQPIPKNIARIFQTYNLFEIKGIHSSLTSGSYYKAIGYAGLFVHQIGISTPLTSLDLSLTFLALRRPKKLFRHLQNERNLALEKTAPGIYHVLTETFRTQIIVTQELPPEENLYLRCLTNRLTDPLLISRLADDCEKHQHVNIYEKYMNQLSEANLKQKGESPMVCEGLFHLFGTSSEEIFARGKKESEDFYLPQINQLSSSNEQLASQINYLKSLLEQHNIPFDLNPGSGEA